MSDVAAVTGQARAIRELLGWASSSQTFVEQTAVLSGPSGSGKTWVAQQLAELVPGTITCVFASGEKSNATRDYFPFSSATMSVPRRSFAAVAIPEVARMVPQVGGLMHFLLDYMLTRKESEQSRKAFSLQEADREILLRLERLAGHGRLLLILDDLQWWDDKSIALVQLMLSNRVNEMFPFLNDTAYLALTTTGQTPTSRSYLDLRERFTSQEVRVGYCDADDYGTILIGLGLHTAIRNTVARELYEITRGHLAIARQLVDYLNNSSDIDDLLKHKDFDGFCARVLDARVRTASEGPALRDVLSCAAVIGLSFSRDELECLAHDYIRVLLKCVHAAKELHLFEEDDSTLRFMHEVYPRVLKTRDPDEKRDLNRRFAQCLLRLRPADYRARARHQRDAGDVFTAHVTEIHGLLADVREGRLGQLSHEYPTGTRHDSLTRFHSLMQEMYAAYQDGSYPEVIQAGRFVDSTLPRSLRAEADYLIALCKTKSLSSAERTEAVKLLERWSAMRDQEPELWGRLTLVRIITLGQIGLNDAMRSVTEEFIEQLDRRAEYDTGAVRMANRLNLRADLLYAPEIAAERLRDAVSYFGPSAAGIAARDPLGYYLALTNLVGNQIVLGNYAVAYDTASACERYIQGVQGTVDDVRFPRPDVLANNSIMSAYRANRVPASEATAFMRSAITSSPRSNDLPLLESNHAGYCLLAGAFPDPSTLEVWFTRLSAGDYETYYTFFVGNNLAAMYLAGGDANAARQRWKQVGALIEMLDERVRPYMSVRQMRLNFELASPGCTMESCERALRSYPSDAVGPSWDHYSHVVLLSELQIWSDG